MIEMLYNNVDTAVRAVYVSCGTGGNRCCRSRITAIIFFAAD